MVEKLQTIKVQKGAIQDLNFISGFLDKRQYEVVTLLAQKERTRISKTKKYLTGKK